MERHCLRCGTPFQGRIDKKFCCDDCRTDWNNERRRERDKKMREVNHILSANWKVLSDELRAGRSRRPAAELAARNFNFQIYTTQERRFPGRRTYWCYNLAYRVSWSGSVRILTRLSE